MMTAIATVTLPFPECSQRVGHSRRCSTAGTPAGPCSALMRQGEPSALYLREYRGLSLKLHVQGY